ncbi:MAG: UDP-N-acetylglucosamine 2-epimerase [Pseudomonadota bacterium]
MRKVVYVTGTRADFGLMRSTLQMLAAAEDIDLGILVTGMHLSAEFGSTWREVEEAGLAISARVPVDVATRSRASMSASLGEAIIGITRELRILKPDAVIVLGDRGEMLAAAVVCLHLGIALFHIHGGERSGTVDEPIRHCISKMATWHLVTTDGSRERLVRMGERVDAITVVGAPGLDGLYELASPTPHQLLSRFGLQPSLPFVLVLFHPVVQQAESAAAQTAVLMDAVLATGLQVLWVGPNSDAGSAGILGKLGVWSEDAIGRAYAVHLGRSEFATAMKHSAVIIGNSSSGIIEAATFGTPVINIGDRQNLRERNVNVVDCEIEFQKLVHTLQQALSTGRYPRKNVYGNGNAGRAIVEAVRTASLDVAAMTKINTY